MIPWTVACQAPLSMGFLRQVYWSGLPFPSPADFLTQEWNPLSCIGRWIIYHWATREAPWIKQVFPKFSPFCFLLWQSSSWDSLHLVSNSSLPLFFSAHFNQHFTPNIPPKLSLSRSLRWRHLIKVLKEETEKNYSKLRTKKNKGDSKAQCSRRCVQKGKDLRWRKDCRSWR